MYVVLLSDNKRFRRQRRWMKITAELQIIYAIIDTRMLLNYNSWISKMATFYFQRNNISIIYFNLPTDTSKHLYIRSRSAASNAWSVKSSFLVNDL